MAGSTFGNLFKITTWGESHGEALGVVIDGCPSGLPLNHDYIQSYLDRRKPGCSPYTTTRRESDKVEILSGIFEGRSTGTPISLLIRNASQRSSDYGDIANVYRPGHADYTYDQKFGFRDYRGGGRSSGRETAGRVAAGAIACKILESLSIEICAYAKSIGPITIDYNRFQKNNILTTPTAMPDQEASLLAEQYLIECMKEQDSAGGVVECVIRNVPAGIGDPVFDKLDASLGKAILSIGAVKAFEVGDGFLVANSKGSLNNDSFFKESGKITKHTNHAGGILGGISDGSPIIMRAFVKPTPSIYSPQNTVTQDGEPILIKIKGRHDPIIVPRAVVVVESMAAITLVDYLFTNMTASMDSIIKYYRKK